MNIGKKERKKNWEPLRGKRFLSRDVERKKKEQECGRWRGRHSHRGTSLGFFPFLRPLWPLFGVRLPIRRSPLSPCHQADIYFRLLAIRVTRLWLLSRSVIEAPGRRCATRVGNRAGRKNFSFSSPTFSESKRIYYLFLFFFTEKREISDITQKARNHHACFPYYVLISTVKRAQRVTRACER